MNVITKPLVLPPDTRFASGAFQNLLEWCRGFGPRGVMVCGQSLRRSGRLDSMLKSQGGSDVRIWLYPGGEPTLALLEALRKELHGYAPDWVAAIGGGSVLDVAKAAAGLMNAPLSALDYHDGASIPCSLTPFIAVPTTAGTGSEATMVSVLTNEGNGVKKSIRHPSFMARLIVLDPELLAGCPPKVMAASGMDALTQAIESFCSVGASWLTDTLCLKAIALLRSGLEPAVRGDRSVLPDLLTGSYLAGLALSNARLGLVHGLAHPLGARFHAPHGLVCAVCLPHVLEFNKSSVPENKYAKLTELFSADPAVYAAAMLDRLNLESPFAGKKPADPAVIIEETLDSGSTKANPRKVSATDVALLLDRIFAE